MLIISFHVIFLSRIQFDRHRRRLLLPAYSLADVNSISIIYSIIAIMNGKYNKAALRLANRLKKY